MSAILYSVFGFIIAIGLLTAVHEFGHFWVARRVGVKVLRFSIGFGRPLFTWHDRYGTEYIIALLPLGGYVKMLDETEEQVAHNERHLAFNQKSVWARMAVIVAGPLSNILFAVFAYWLMFFLGLSAIAPVLGETPKGSIAYLAGLTEGHEIVQINDTPTRTWEEVSVQLMPYLGEQTSVIVHAKDKDTQQETQHVMDLSGWQMDEKRGQALKNLGFVPFDPVKPVVGRLMADFPGERAGLVVGDQILAADDQPMANRSQLTRYLRERPNEVVVLKVKRQADVLDIRLTPERKLIEGGQEVGFIGIEFAHQPYPKSLVRTVRFGFFGSMGMAVQKTKDYTLLTIQFLQKMIVGKVSFQNIAGPVSIAKYAGETARVGLEYFLGFLALVSISLGVVNMLPIPILDGGQFVYCIYELIHGRPPSEKILDVGRVIGLLFLGFVMIFALYNDLMRL